MRVPRRGSVGAGLIKAALRWAQPGPERGIDQRSRASVVLGG
jgi:hypothetical protein